MLTESGSSSQLALSAADLKLVRDWILTGAMR
jgi:hypothetical protein